MMAIAKALGIGAPRQREMPPIDYSRTKADITHAMDGGQPFVTNDGRFDQARVEQLPLHIQNLIRGGKDVELGAIK
jgi:hypothetical protein